jgi:hypothetical protein
MQTRTRVILAAAVLIPAVAALLIAMDTDAPKVTTVLGYLPTGYQERVATSYAAQAAFVRSHPCPVNGGSDTSCPGYVVTHIVRRACGGTDEISNWQWQTVEESNARTGTESGDCAKSK